MSGTICMEEKATHARIRGFKHSDYYSELTFMHFLQNSHSAKTFAEWGFGSDLYRNIILLTFILTPTQTPIMPRTDGFQDIDTAAASKSSVTDDPILIVLDPKDPSQTFQSVLEVEDFSEGIYYFLLAYPTREFYERKAARIKAKVPQDYSLPHLSEDARQEAKRVSQEWIDSEGAEIHPVGRVGPLRLHVRKLDSEFEFSRIYIPKPDKSILDRLIGHTTTLDTLAGNVSADVIPTQ